MSAGVSDQRMKGQGIQVNNGPKEQLGDGGVAPGSVSEDFESWRSQQQQAQQQQQAGGAAHTPYAASVPISSATDPYNMSTAAGYYGSGGTFPYQAFGVGDGTWSNGTDPMTFLGGYTHDSYSMDGMFGPSTTFSTTAFGQPSAFNYFPGNGDYSTWGTQLNQRKAHYDDYYRADTQNMYAATPQAMQDTNLTLKSVEQNMQNLSIDMNTTNNLHMNTQLSHNLGPQLAKGDGKDMKGADGGVKDSSGISGVQPKKMTWASIASQPAKPQVTLQSTGLKKKGPGMPPGPIVPGKHNMDIGTWDTNKSTPPQIPVVNSAPPPPAQKVAVNVRAAWPGPAVRAQPQPGQPTQQMNARPPQQQIQQPPPPPNVAQPQQQQPTPMPPPQVVPPQVQQAHYIAAPPHPGVGVPHMAPHQNQGMPPQPQGHPTVQQQMMMGPPPAIVSQHQQQAPPNASHPVLDELRVKNNYNPQEFDLSAPGARFFVIKSYSEDDIHRSIKYEIWCSTEHGNKRLDQAFREREKEPKGCVYLFFSVNGSGHFCGMAQMMSSVDYHSNSSVWSQDKWRGQFRVRWIYVKDVPNLQLRHIRLENNENKPVTNSRDTQEVPHSRGLQVLRILHTYKHSTSIFDDFIHYEKRQEEEDSRKIPEVQQPPPGQQQHVNHQRGGGGESHHNSGGGSNHRGENHHINNARDSHGGGRDSHRSGRDGGGRDHRDSGHHSRSGGSDNQRDGGRDHRDRRNQQDRDSMHENHRSGNQRNNHDGPHHKDRGDNNSRGRGGRTGRNIN